MKIDILKSKIHKVTVTGADLNYIGSITIDESLMEASKIIEGEDRLTKNILNKYELTKIICERANSIVNGAVPLVSTTIEMDAQEIAYEELRQKRCPYYVYRRIPSTKDKIFEKWNPNEMIIPALL